MREGTTAMATVLDRLPDTEAVIGVSDLSAFGALTGCQRRGVPVPEDIAIAGFGAFDIASICVPTISPARKSRAASALRSCHGCVRQSTTRSGAT